MNFNVKKKVRSKSIFHKIYIYLNIKIPKIFYKMAFEKTVEAQRGHIPSFKLNVRCHKGALTKRQAISS